MHRMDCRAVNTVNNLCRFTFWILVVMFKVLMVISQIPSQKFHGSRLPNISASIPGSFGGSQPANRRATGAGRHVVKEWPGSVCPSLRKVSSKFLETLPWRPRSKRCQEIGGLFSVYIRPWFGNLYLSLNRHVRNKVNPNQHLQSRLVSWHLEIILTLHSSRPDPSNQPPTVVPS